jgi:ABC-2 type transport system permease protein
MVYAVMAAYLSLVVPKMFHFIHIAAWQDILQLMIPYLLACVFFGLTVSCLVRYRENVILLVVFVSLPLLFLTGVSWPQSSIPGYLQGVSWLFPSTFGVRAYLRLNSMGGTIADVSLEMRCLWIQVAAYFGTACLVYGHQLRTTRQHASERLVYLRKKREVREAIKSKKLSTGQ